MPRLKLRNLVGVCIAVCVCVTIWARPQTNTAVDATASVTAVPVATVAQLDKVCDSGAKSGDSLKKCWTTYFEGVAAQDGVVSALKAIQDIGKTNKSVSTSCHDFDHNLGRWAYSNTQNVVEALTHDDRACQYGFMHGVLEAFAIEATDAEMQEKLGVVCEPYRAALDTPGLERDLRECLHGIGHAAAVHTQDDVFKALEWCRLGTSTLNEIENCTGGVLMEYGNSAVKQRGGGGPLGVAHGPGDSQISDDVAMSLCNKVKSEFERECWRRASMFWGALKVPTPAMLKMCVKDSGADSDRCAAGVGVWVMLESYKKVRELSGVPQYIADACAVEKRIEGWCLYGAVYPITSNAIWDNTPLSTWMELCSLATSEDAKKTCRLGELQAVQALPDVERRMALGRARGFTDKELTAKTV